MTNGRWVRAALIVGLAYFMIGRVFVIPATHVHFWRPAAWAVSAVAYLAQIAYEHFSLRSSPRALAFHTAVGAVVGAFALAVAGLLHSVARSSASYLWVLALVLWPAVTAIPAFIVAFVIAVVLQRAVPRA